MTVMMVVDTWQAALSPLITVGIQTNEHDWLWFVYLADQFRTVHGWEEVTQDEQMIYNSKILI